MEMSVFKIDDIVQTTAIDGVEIEAQIIARGFYSDEIDRRGNPSNCWAIALRPNGQLMLCKYQYLFPDLVVRLVTIKNNEPFQGLCDLWNSFKPILERCWQFTELLNALKAAVPQEARHA